MEIKKTEIPENVIVMAVKAKTFPEGIQEAWSTLTNHLSMSGRKPYGFSYCNGSEVEYYAAIQEDTEGEAKESGLLVKIIPKGKYFVTSLHNWKSRIPEIGSHFQSMMTRADVGKPTFCLEFYKDDDVVELLVNCA